MIHRAKHQLWESVSRNLGELIAQVFAFLLPKFSVVRKHLLLCLHGKYTNHSEHDELAQEASFWTPFTRAE